MNAALPIPAPPEPDADLFRRGMRRLAAGVCIITTIDADGPHGFVATAVSSVSAEPMPSLLVCTNRSSSTHPRITETGRFCVNVLAEDDVETARRFTSSDRLGRFADTEWVALATGAPAFPSALVSFDCDVSAELDVHSHTIFVGNVREVRLWRDAIAPLLYVDGSYARVEKGG